jgi:aminoglycoside phosphotransferase (APT) family kinase protein
VDGPTGYRGVPLATRETHLREAIAQLAGKEVETAAKTALWEEALRVPRYSGAPIWAHGDLMPGNLLVREGGSPP